MQGNPGEEEEALRFQTYRLDNPLIDCILEELEIGYCDGAGTEILDNPAVTPGVDCDRVSGNTRIVCAAEEYTGVRYANYNAGTGSRWADEWGVTPRGNLGQNAETWIAQREAGGGLDSATDFLECSGYVNVAVYTAFGVESYSCSADYRTRNPNFREIPVSEMRPGDLGIRSLVCGNNGHVGIFVEWLPDGRMRFLESSAGRNDDQNVPRSGYYTRSANYYPYAARYIGPGSSP